MGHDYHSTFFFLINQIRYCSVSKDISWLCFHSGLFPNNCKIARVTPIHKMGAKDNLNNYCPISILTSNFFITNRVLFENHYGFQTNICTTHAMLNVFTFFYDNIDNLCKQGVEPNLNPNRKPEWTVSFWWTRTKPEPAKIYFSEPEPNLNP